MRQDVKVERRIGSAGRHDGRPWRQEERARQSEKTIDALSDNDAFDRNIVIRCDRGTQLEILGIRVHPIFGGRVAHGGNRLRRRTEDALVRTEPGAKRPAARAFHRLRPYEGHELRQRRNCWRKGRAGHWILRLGDLEKAEIGEFLSHFCRHHRNLISRAHFDVGRRVGIFEVTPALKGASRGRPHRDQSRVQQNMATRRSVVSLPVLQSDEVLANENGAAHHPVKRSAVEQVGLSFRRLMRWMIDTSLPDARLAPPILFLPRGQIFDRSRADAKFDEVAESSRCCAPGAGKRQLCFPQPVLDQGLAVQIPAYCANIG